MQENFFDGDLDSPVVSILLGGKRPKYTVLEETLGRYLLNCCVGEEKEVTMFFNLNSLFKLLFNDYAIERLTRGEIKRNPFALAFELLQLCAHYRNYIWKYNIKTSIVFFYSDEKCIEKTNTYVSYKEKLYNKQLNPLIAEFELIRNYVKSNILLASRIALRIPNTYFVNTGSIDPEVWPYAFIKEGKVNCTSFIVSLFTSDYQYLTLDTTYPCCILQPNAQHTKLITKSNFYSIILKDIKSLKDKAHLLNINLIPYLIALIGSEDFSISGIPKMRIGRAMTKLLGYEERGLIGEGTPSKEILLSLVEDNYKNIIEINWNTLNYESYYKKITDTEMFKVENQIEDINEPGIIPEVNSKYFCDTPIDTKMIFAGEGQY
jgi:hypothetical protein